MKLQLAPLVIAHIAAIALAPFSAVLVLTLWSGSPADTFHVGGALAIIFTVLSAYLFLSIPLILTVVMTAPFIFCISRIPSPLAGFVGAILFGMAIGLAFEAIFIRSAPGGSLNGQLMIITAMMGVAVTIALEQAWRRFAVWKPDES